MIMNDAINEKQDDFNNIIREKIIYMLIILMFFTFFLPTSVVIPFRTATMKGNF